LPLSHAADYRYHGRRFLHADITLSKRQAGLRWYFTAFFISHIDISHSYISDAASPPGY